MRTLAELKELISAERNRAYGLKTKKAKERAYGKIRELDREVCSLLYAQCEQYKPETIVATVERFTSGDDHFLINTKYGLMWVSPTGDVLSKSWYSHTCCIEYSIGQEIELEVSFEVNTDRYFIEIVPGKMRGGRVNETQYAELCKRDNLAFFKYPNSSGVTGLFAAPKAVSGE